MRETICHYLNEIQDIKELTLKAVCIEEVFAFLVALDSAFGATYSLVRSLFRSCPIEDKNLKVSFLSGERSFGLFAAGKSYFPLIIEGHWRIAPNLGIPMGFVHNNKGVLLTATLTAPLDQK